MADKLNLPGLTGKTAQREGSAGTPTTQTSDGKGGTTPAVAPQTVAEQQAEQVRRRESDPVDRQTMVNNPPPVVSGTSASLATPESNEAAPADEQSPEQRLNESVALQRLADQGVTSQDGVTRFSSHPIMNYRIGRFQFDRGLLTLDDKDTSDFRALLDKLPATERARISEIDVAGAERIVQQRLANQPIATKLFDSSTGGRAADIHKLGPTVGAVPLGFENRAQQDMNAPVVPTPPVDDGNPLDMGAHTPPEDAAKES